jgi:hypothetical protein
MATRALMRKYGVGYETVQRALVSALPEPRKNHRNRHRILLDSSAGSSGGRVWDVVSDSR